MKVIYRTVNVLFIDSTTFTGRLVYKLKNMAECIHQSRDDTDLHIYDSEVIQDMV